MMISRKVSLSSALFALVLTACAGFNPISQAETSQQKALAAYGSVTIMVEQIALLLEPDTFPDNIQTQLIRVAELGGATAASGLVAYQEAEAARLAFEQDSAQVGRLNAAISSLDSWVTRASPVIDSLKSALRGVR